MRVSHACNVRRIFQANVLEIYHAIVGKNVSEKIGENIRSFFMTTHAANTLCLTPVCFEHSSNLETSSEQANINKHQFRLDWDRLY